MEEHVKKRKSDLILCDPELASWLVCALKCHLYPNYQQSSVVYMKCGKISIIKINDRSICTYYD